MDPRVIKRIIKEYNYVQNNPLPGIAIVQENPQDFTSFIVNIKVLDGILKDACLQLFLNLSENYPIKAPKVQIKDQQPLRYPYHHHVFRTQMCVDILEDAFMNPKVIGTGWTSAYTLEAILVQIQSFVADPDLPKYSQHKRDYIENNLLENQKHFKSVLQDLNGKEVIHTWENPYPPFPAKISQKQYYEQQIKNIITEQEKISQEIQCFQLKENFLTFQQEKLNRTDVENTLEKNTTLTLGVPIDLSIDNFERIYPQPIPEILSLEGYLNEIKNKGLTLAKNKFTLLENKTKILDLKIKSGMGSKYNFWLPIFINREHFSQNKQLIEYHLTLLENLALKQNDEEEQQLEQVKKIKEINKIEIQNSLIKQKFNPTTIFKVLPAILNKLVLYLSNGTMHKSQNAIQIYVHFAQLFNELIETYKDECRAILNKKLNEFLKGDEFRSKRAIGDLGEFIQILMIARPNFYQDQRIMQALTRELLARQVLWIVKAKAAQQFTAKNFEEEAKFAFTSQTISLQLFLFNVKVAQKFGQKEFLSKIQENYCILDQNKIRQFLKDLFICIKSIKDFQSWFKYIGIDYDEDVIYHILKDSYQISNEQGYTLDANLKIITKEEIEKKEREINLKQQQKQKQIIERAIQRDQRKEKIQKEKEEQDQKDVEEILALDNDQKQEVKKLESQYNKYEKESQQYKKSLQQLEQDLFDKFFDKNDPFAVYADPQKEKQYKKELQELKKNYDLKIMKERKVMLELEDKVEEIYECKYKVAESEINQRREQREKEQWEKEIQWQKIQMARQQAWEAKKQQMQKERELQKEQRKQKVIEHKNLTNNGLGFDRLKEAKKKEMQEQKLKAQQRMKQNIFLALEDDEEEHAIYA